jgi:calcineurin-like phosphoesterase family protein
MKEKGSIHLHGHTHGKSNSIVNRMDVSVEALNYIPISIEDVIKHNKP